MKRNKITGQLSFDDFLKQEELNSSFDNLLLPAEQYARKNGSLHIGTTMRVHIGTTMRVFRISAIRAENIVHELIRKGVLRENCQVHKKKSNKNDS